MLEKIQFRTTKDGVTALTEQIQKCVEKSGVRSGLLCAFITHTTAALTVNSFWDPLGHEDIQDEIRRLIPTRVDFKHQHDTQMGRRIKKSGEVRSMAGCICPGESLVRKEASYEEK